MTKKRDEKMNEPTSDVRADEETDLASLELEALESTTGGFRIGVPRQTIRLPGSGGCQYA